MSPERFFPRRRPVGPRRWLLAAAWVGCWAVLQAAAEPAPLDPPIVIGMVHSESSVLARWYRLIYVEAFGRLGRKVEVQGYPLARIGLLLDKGLLDGEAARAGLYAQAHPELVRVEESVFDIVFELYATRPLPPLKRLEDLPASKLQVIYPRGMLFCEKALRSVLPPEQVADVTDGDLALKMLLTGRADVLCSNNVGMQGVQLDAADMLGVDTVRSVLGLEATPLYPYLLRKHAALAPRLAAALKKMKAEGLIERFRREAMHEAAGPR